MKKLKILEREVPIVVVFLILFAGLGSAALLNYYGRVSSTVTVDQSIILTGTDCTDNECPDTANVGGGETYLSDKYTVQSQTGAIVPFEITSVNNAGEGANSYVEFVLRAYGTAGTEERIDIEAADVGSLSDLDSLSSMEFMQKVTEGYIGHVDVFLDINGDGVYDSSDDDVLVFEYDKIATPSDQAVADMNYNRDVWVNTFDDKGIINDNAIAWLNSGDPGNLANPCFIYATLSQWQAGNVGSGQSVNPSGASCVLSALNGDGLITQANKIDGSTKVLRIQIEVDNWITDSRTEVKDIKINGDLVSVLSLLPGDHLGFKVATEFDPAIVPGSYVITTKVEPIV